VNVRAPISAWPAQVAGYDGHMADKTFSKGDKVEWNSHGGKAVGKVERKITSDTEAGGRKVKASEDDPQYLVKSDKSGGTAVHKPSALKKRS
jgi:hypothetical protein